jgi:signal transduction histidine kinase
VRAIADGKTFNGATSAKLAARTKNLEIDYTAVSLNRASRVRFRYKLEGMDAGWQNAGSRRQVFYSNLSPGRYRFVVSASNGDNLWNEAGATMNMEVPPAFNQTTWFRSLCVLAAMLGLWGILRLRIRQTVAKVQAQFRERMLERERIAGDLHDTLLQGYLSASLQVHAAFGRLAEDSPAKQPLRRALELIGKASEESRIVLRGIRSSQLGDLELGQALSRIPHELAASADVGFRVRVEGRPRSLRPVLLDDVYRIGREAIVNAFQHAGATNIEVEVEYAANRLRMLVQDNGCGIDAQMLQSGKAGHWGLKGMRERAERIGGKLNLFSNPGAGTQVVLTVAAQLAFEPEDVGKRRGWVHRLFRPYSGHSEQAKMEDRDERASSHQNTQR